MAAGPGRGLTAEAQEERAVAELDASRRELVASVTRQLDFYVEQMQMEPAEAAARARERLRHEPDSREPEQVMWWHLTNLLEHDPERGQAAWQALKDEAARELSTATRAARSLERPVGGTPYERAQFAALVHALRDALAPRNALDELLIEQMASAYDLHLRWQRVAVQRVEEGAWQGERDRRRALEEMRPTQRERYQADTGWLPPRLGEGEAQEQAVLMADRYQRAFLRLLKAYRDQRRLLGSVVVAGGQLNVAGHQLVVGGGAMGDEG